MSPTSPSSSNRDIAPNLVPNVPLGNQLRIVVWVLTIVVWLLVGAMRRTKFPLPDGMSLSFLPMVHAILNSCVAAFLVSALVMIKRKNIAAHRRFISAAMIASASFLLCYVAYHFTTEETKFGGTGAICYVYYPLLISHIVLAAFSLPFILQTWVYGFTSQVAKHRKMAKWVFPMWLYVAITGPICYLLLRPYY